MGPPSRLGVIRRQAMNKAFGVDSVWARRIDRRQHNPNLLLRDRRLLKRGLKLSAQFLDVAHGNGRHLDLDAPDVASRSLRCPVLLNAPGRRMVCHAVLQILGTSIP